MHIFHSTIVTRFSELLPSITWNNTFRVEEGVRNYSMVFLELQRWVHLSSLNPFRSETFPLVAQNCLTLARIKLKSWVQTGMLPLWVPENTSWGGHVNRQIIHTTTLLHEPIKGLQVLKLCILYRLNPDCTHSWSSIFVSYIQKASVRTDQVVCISSTGKVRAKENE